MTDYYTPEELDAMDVGTEVTDPEDHTAKKASDGTWRGYYDMICHPEVWGQLSVLSAPVSPSQPTYPTPTLGELVALRESILRAHEDNYHDDYWDRLEYVNRLIDERIGFHDE